MPFYQGLTRDRVSGVLDTAFTSLDLTSDVKSLFGGAVNLGTGGAASLEYKRIGREVRGIISITFGTSPTIGGGPIYIANTDLPFVAKTVSVGDPGGFGAVFKTADGMLESAIPIVTNVGQIILGFFVPPGDGGIGNLLSNVIPLPLSAGSSIIGEVSYEAASAE